MKPNGTKRCSKCRSTKQIVEFSNDKGRQDGKSPWCKECVRKGQLKWLAKPGKRELKRAYQRKRAQRPDIKAKMLAYQKTEVGKTIAWRVRIKAKYGLSHEEYNVKLAAQGGRCAVCHGLFKDRKTTHVDHCHTTGKVRDILCHNCNRALGAAHDDEKILSALIDYLRRHRCGS
jgi:hypothetical protein